MIEDRLRLFIGGLGLLACIAFVLTTGGESYSHLEDFSSISTFDQIIHEIQQLSKVYIFLYFFARGRGRLLRADHYILIAIVAIYVVIFAASSSKAVAIELLAMWVLGNAAGAVRGNLIREMTIGAGALASTYLIFYFVTAYRLELVQLVSTPAKSYSEALSTQLSAFEAALTKVMSGQPVGSTYNPYEIGSIFDRLGLVTAFAQLLEMTGSSSPYEHAAVSFMAPIYAVLPRASFSEKVQYLDPGRFAQMLGWQFGGFSVTLPGSLFWAWGFEGIVPSMMALGAFLALASHRGRGDGPGAMIWRVPSTLAVLDLLDVGTSFQPIIISMVRGLIFVCILRVVAQTAFQHSAFAKQ
jgi:hypothetical protein